MTVWDDKRWDAFCGLLEEAWPGEFDDAVAASWRVLLDAVPPEQATVALRRLLLEGRRFRPSVSEFLAAVRTDPSQPTFPEAYHLIFGHGGALRAASRGGTETFGEPAEERAAGHAVILRRAAELHPLVGTFVQRQGIERLRGLALSDPEWGEKHRRDLEAAWDRHVEAFDGRQVATLAAGHRDGLHQLDPLTAMGLPGPARQLEAAPDQTPEKEPTHV